MIKQTGMINHLYAKILDLELNAEDSVALTASLTFDISVWQFMSALLIGSSACIVEYEITLQPVKLLSLVKSKQVTVLEVVPSLLCELLIILRDDLGFLNGTSLKCLICTGEALPESLCHQWYSIYPSIPLFNA